MLQAASQQGITKSSWSLPCFFWLAACIAARGYTPQPSSTSADSRIARCLGPCKFCKTRQQNQAYRGDDRLDYQLTAQFKLWLRDETKGLTFNEAKKPMLSRIFLWYAGDFESRGGSPAYAAQYAPAGAARDALATTAPDYFAYDWNLNTQ